MPKRKQNNFHDSGKTRSSNSSTTNGQCDKVLTDVTNTHSRSTDEEFLDNTQVTMKKRKKHLENFYDRTKEVPG
jgi:hypothetical protein